MDASLPRLAKTAGSALAIVSVVFIAALLFREREALLAFRPGAAGTAILASCALAYALLGWVLAEAWRRLLIWTGEAQVQAADTCRVYAQTQIAKYVPG